MVFSQNLLKWYNDNRRPLPWRQTKDPYCIWVSEIILQQTRVDQGLPYYEAFIKKFPNVEALAKASENEVLKAWQGLGYYSRARNLHHTAKEIAGREGVFPSHYSEIIKLKGIGSYTAAAISSICFNEPQAVVDGNVYRVLSRYHGLSEPVDSSTGKKIFSKLANNALDWHNPGDYNQAIMEFGALHCTPNNPKCTSCCIKTKCVAQLSNTVASYPVKTKKVKSVDRYFNYIMIRGDKGTFYQKRTHKDIWQNMYEPLLIESKKHLSKNGIQNSEGWLSVFGNGAEIKLRRSDSMEHKLTHQTIKARFWEARIDSTMLKGTSRLVEFKEPELKKIPIPRLIERYLECYSEPK